MVPYFMKHTSKCKRAASNLSHDLGPFLVVELQLCDSLVDAHPSDLWRRTKRRDVTMRQVFYLSITLKTTLTTGDLWTKHQEESRMQNVRFLTFSEDHFQTYCTWQNSLCNQQLEIKEPVYTGLWHTVRHIRIEIIHYSFWIFIAVNSWTV